MSSTVVFLLVLLVVANLGGFIFLLSRAQKTHGLPTWDWPDARGYIGLGSFLLVLIVLGSVIHNPTLLENDAFLILATALVITGWVQGPVGWAYQETKQGGELAHSAQRNAERAIPAPPRQLPAPGQDAEPDVILRPGETAQASAELPTRPEQELPGEFERKEP